MNVSYIWTLDDLWVEPNGDYVAHPACGEHLQIMVKGEFADEVLTVANQIEVQMALRRHKTLGEDLGGSKADAE